MAATRRYRVGIIGCGPRAGWHADALRHMPEVDLVAAADIREDRLGAFCDRWEIPGRYADAAAMLSEHALDLATVCTLPPAHRPLVSLCAAAGVPAINCEKVIAYRVEDLDAMIGACEASGALLTVNHQMRFMPQFQAVRGLAASGRLGDIQFLRASSRGNLLEQGTHTVDQMLFMNGDEPAEWVLAQADGVEGYSRTHPAPSTIEASIRFRNGARGFLESGMLGHEVDPAGGFWLQKFVEITGSRGWAGAYVNNGWRAVLDSGEVLSGPGTWEPNWPAQAALFRTALDWVDDRSVVHPTRAEIARRGLDILLGVCAGALRRGTCVLPLERGRDFLGELSECLGPGHGITP